MGPAVANLPVKGFPSPDFTGTSISGSGTYGYSQYSPTG
jgi:hypothetical protein